MGTTEHRRGKAPAKRGKAPRSIPMKTETIKISTGGSIIEVEAETCESPTGKVRYARLADGTLYRRLPGRRWARCNDAARAHEGGGAIPTSTAEEARRAFAAPRVNPRLADAE